MTAAIWPPWRTVDVYQVDSPWWTENIAIKKQRRTWSHSPIFMAIYFVRMGIYSVQAYLLFQGFLVLGTLALVGRHSAQL